MLNHLKVQDSLLVSAITTEEVSRDDNNEGDISMYLPVYHFLPFPAMHANNSTNMQDDAANGEISNQEPIKTVDKPHHIDSKSPNVVIHVCDESRNLEKSFECNRQLLIDKMTYFKQYLNSDDQEDDEEVDISVHCDILVFEWLIQYISAEENPTLEVHNVVSILISSHFLQMETLVEECIDFMSKYLNQIIQLPLDLSCLNDEIVNAICDKLTILNIDLLNDSTDKILSRLYRYHLQAFLKNKEHKLYYCVYCGELYTKEQRKKLICYKAPIYITFHGEIVRKHCAQRGWYLQKYLLGLRLQNYSWKAIYWHLWSLTRSPLFCYECNQYVTSPNIYNCAYHVKEAVSAGNRGLNTLIHPCCQAKQDNFEMIQTQKKGCSNKQHQVIIANDNSGEIQKVLNIIATHSQYVLIPFECSKSCSLSPINNVFLERPQSADHRSRLLKHSHHHSSRHSSKRFSVNALPKTTGVWDPKYFVFGSQSSSKALKVRGHQNVLHFDVYHETPTFWHYDEYNEENRNKDGNNMNEDSFEYLSYLLTFDNIDYEGDDDKNVHSAAFSNESHMEREDEEDDEDLFTDGSVDMDDVIDLFSSQNVIFFYIFIFWSTLH